MRTLEAICKDYISGLDPNNRFLKYMSYSKWAAEEIITQRSRYPDVSDITYICLILDKFEKYSCMDPSTSRMFSIGACLADYILDELLDEGRINE